MLVYYTFYICCYNIQFFSTVDENEAYDNIDLRTQDEEDKYFDSESPETIGSTENTNEIESEDELDIYMKSLKVN